MLTSDDKLLHLFVLLRVDHEELSFFGTRYGYWLGIARLDSADRSLVSFVYTTDPGVPELEWPTKASSVTHKNPGNVTYATLVYKTASV